MLENPSKIPSFCEHRWSLWIQITFPHLAVKCGNSISSQYAVYISSVQFNPVAQSCLTLRSHESQHARLPCPSPTPGDYSNPCSSSRWCHPAISSSIVPFSCPQSLPASGSFIVSQLFAWGGQSIGVSASALVLRWTPRTECMCVETLFNGRGKALCPCNSSTWIVDKIVRDQAAIIWYP